MPAAAPFPHTPGDKRESFAQARGAVRQALRDALPLKVYGRLLDSGWPREWAEELVREVELRDRPDNAETHRLADRAQLHLVLGLVLGMGGAVAVAAFMVLGSRIFIPGVVAAVTGGALFTRGLKASRRYPRRPLPGRGLFERTGVVNPRRDDRDPY